MNFKLTMSLVVVLLVAAIIFMLLPKDAPPPPTNTDGSTPLLAKTPEGLKTITHLHNGAVQVKFEKDGNTWMMTTPTKAAVDSSVSGIASSLLNLSYLRKFEPQPSGDKSAEATGTATPHDIIKFTDTANVEYTLAIGYRSMDGAYATLNGQKTIYDLKTNPLRDFIKDDINDFRDRSIKKLDLAKITKLDVKKDKELITLSKIDGKWLITARDNTPFSARANTVVVEDIVKIFADIKALKFISLRKERTGLEPVSLSVTAWVEDEASASTTASAPATAASQSQPVKLTPVTLQLGYATDLTNREVSSVFAGIAGVDEVFTVGRDTFTKMNKELKDLRDSAVVPVQVRQATEITLTTRNADGSATTLAANSKGQEWTLATEPKPLAGDARAIGDYLGVIGDLRAIKFVDNAGDLKSLSLDPPHQKIELTLPGQTQREVLLVGQPQEALEGGKVMPVMRQGEPTVYLVQMSDAEKLATSALQLRNREIVRLDPDKIRKIEIAGPLATVGITPPAATAPATASAPATTSAPATAPALPLTPGVTLEREGTRWVVNKAGTTLPSDDSKITALLSGFTPLSAMKYVDTKPVGKNTPDITVTLTVLETAYTPTATAPATAPTSAPATSTATTATASAPATATKPTLAELLPDIGIVGPDAGKLVTYTLKLYRQETPATATAPAAASQPAVTWSAVWDTQSPAWTFEPSSYLMELFSKEIYTVTPGVPAPATPKPMDFNF